ncbi:MAG: hypothetical protein J0I06_21545 [Planctomycetes bacterium]|nr:hypothetical protein [Planctomycetota bacterium]
MSNNRLRFKCPRCGAKLSAPPRAAGKRVRCPACPARVVVPYPIGDDGPEPADAAVRTVRPAWFVGGAGAVLVVGLVLALAVGRKKAPEQPPPAGSVETVSTPVPAPAVEKPPLPTPADAAARAEVEAQWEAVKGLDRGQGAGKLLDGIEADLRSARSTYDAGRYTRARPAFEAVQQKCRQLRELEDLRERARAARGKADEARQEAERAAAATDANALWSEGQQQAQAAARDFEAGLFPAALSNWERASRTHAAAARHAEGVRLVAAARTKYQNELNGCDPKQLETDDPTGWGKVAPAVASAARAADEGRHTDAAEGYRDAIELLKAARRRAALPRLQYWAFIAGFTGCSVATLKEPGQAPAPALVTVLRTAYARLEMKTAPLDRLERERNLSQKEAEQLLIAGELVDPLERAHGKEVSGAFTVGIIFARLWMFMEAQELKLGPDDRFRAQLGIQLVISAAKGAQFPREVIASFEKARGVLDGAWRKETVRECNKILRAANAQLLKEETAVPLFRKQLALSKPEPEPKAKGAAAVAGTWSARGKDAVIELKIDPNGRCTWMVGKPTGGGRVEGTIGVSEVVEDGTGFRLVVMGKRVQLAPGADKKTLELSGDGLRAVLEKE